MMVGLLSCVARITKMTLRYHPKIHQFLELKISNNLLECKKMSLAVHCLYAEIYHRHHSVSEKRLSSLVDGRPPSKYLISTNDPMP